MQAMTKTRQKTTTTPASCLAQFSSRLTRTDVLIAGMVSFFGDGDFADWCVELCVLILALYMLLFFYVSLVLSVSWTLLSRCLGTRRPEKYVSRGWTWLLREMSSWMVDLFVSWNFGGLRVRVDPLRPDVR
ncbi:hypothetical protein MCOR25_005001 [Pyricularia grisea]|nr:hypothetical protein MCOR25_005001 [Pyricularia grisea]